MSEPIAPDAAKLTDYDRRHFLTYARLLDDIAASVDWRLSADTILGTAPTEPVSA